MKSFGCVAVILSSIPLAASPTQAQWVPTNGPYSAGSVSLAAYALSVRSLAVSPNRAGGTNLFAGTTDGNGIFLSSNNGISWTGVNSGLINTGVRSLAVSPNGAGGTNVFAGGEQGSLREVGGGVFLSTDNGTSWTGAGLTNSNVLSLVLNGTDLFAGTWGGGVFLSTNNGSSWTAVNSGLANTYVYALAVSPSGAGGTNLFAGTDGAGVFLSTDNGSSWTAVSSGLTSPFVWSLVVSGTNLFAGTAGGGVFLSTNNGSSWTALKTGLWPTTVYTMVATGTDLFAGTAGGVFHWTNADGWHPVNENFGTTSGGAADEAYSLVISGQDLFAGTAYTGVFRRPLAEIVTSAGNFSGELSLNFSLSQNFPNPFNPSTTIQFSIVNTQYTILNVYDVLGREIATLVNEVKRPGTHMVEWNAQGMPSGVYFYRLQAGAFVQTRKLLLLR